MVAAASAGGPTRDHVLNDIGVRQAALVGAYVAALPPPRAIFSSDRPDALATASAIRTALGERSPVRRAGKLRECVPGRSGSAPNPSAPFEELVYAAGTRHSQAAFARWFKPARTKDKHDVLVTHPNLLRSLVCCSIGVDPLTWSQLRIDAGGISRVRVRSDGTFELLCFNERSFLMEADPDVPF